MFQRTPHGARAESNGFIRRILLFTSSLGSGHMRAAKAIELALHDRIPDATVRTLDFWSLMDDKVAWAIRTAYLRLVQEHSGLYDRIYHLDQRTWRAILGSSKPLPPELAEIVALVPRKFPNGRVTQGARTRPIDRMLLLLLIATLSGHVPSTLGNSRLLRLVLVQSAWAQFSRRLASFVRGFRPDVIAATQMLPAALLSSARNTRRVYVPTIGVLTDYGVHDFWIQPGVDLYCLAHESIHDLRAAGVPAHKVMITGIPLMPGFTRPPGIGEARHALGLDMKRPVILVAGGGLGLGVDAVASRLLQRPNDAQILVTVGRNPSARQVLAPLASRHPDRLRVWEWTERMEHLVRAADVVIGKPGGLTVAEALACGRPLIATHALQGQEGFNVRFLQKHGAGQLVPEDRLGNVLDALLSDKQALAAMQTRALMLGRHYGAERIAGLVQQFSTWQPQPRKRAAEA